VNHFSFLSLVSLYPLITLRSRRWPILVAILAGGQRRSYSNHHGSDSSTISPSHGSTVAKRLVKNGHGIFSTRRRYKCLSIAAVKNQPGPTPYLPAFFLFFFAFTTPFCLRIVKRRNDGEKRKQLQETNPINASRITSVYDGRRQAYTSLSLYPTIYPAKKGPRCFPRRSTTSHTHMSRSHQ
jgi:hypothetical protein